MSARRIIAAQIDSGGVDMVGKLQTEDPRSVGPYGLLGRLGAVDLRRILYLNLKAYVTIVCGSQPISDSASDVRCQVQIGAGGPKPGPRCARSAARGDGL